MEQEHGKDFVYLDEHEEDVHNLQLMYEDLEENYHLAVSALAGFIAFLEYDKWYYALPVSIVLYVLLRKFHSKNVFDKDIRHDRKN